MAGLRFALLLTCCGQIDQEKGAFVPSAGTERCLCSRCPGSAAPGREPALCHRWHTMAQPQHIQPELRTLGAAAAQCCQPGRLLFPLSGEANSSPHSSAIAGP